MLFHRILCAVDFSDDSREAMRVAAELARQSQAVLVLTHVWQVPIWLTTNEYQVPNEVFQETIDVSEQKLEEWKAEARKLGASEVKTSFSTGVPWDRIVALASTEPRADLIVTGTHGRTGIKHALIGSVAETVVRHAPCPVLVVRTRHEG